MCEIKCLGRDGKYRTFAYRYKYDSGRGEWEFKVDSIPPPDSGELFQFTFKELSDGTVRLIAVYHEDEPAYVAMGIPDELLVKARVIIGKPISSSPSNGGGNTFRTDRATKMWERLKDKCVAQYDKQNEFYFIP